MQVEEVLIIHHEQHAVGTAGPSIIFDSAAVEKALSVLLLYEDDTMLKVMGDPPSASHTSSPVYTPEVPAGLRRGGRSGKALREG